MSQQNFPLGSNLAHTFICRWKDLAYIRTLKVGGHLKSVLKWCFNAADGQNVKHIHKIYQQSIK